MAADNVERFAFLYEYVAEPLEKGMRKATDAVDTFVGVTTKGLISVTSWVAKTTTSLVALGGRKILGGLGRISKSLTSWGRETFQVESRLGGIFSIFKTVAKMGGLAMLLGPFALLIKPIMSIIRVITDTLQPALDTISGAMTAAFAPLAQTLQQVAIKVLPHLMRVVDPIVKMFVTIAEEAGSFFEGDMLGDFLGTVIELAGVVKDMATTFIRDFLKPIGGTIFRVVLQLFQSLAKAALAFVVAIKPYLPVFLQTLQKVAGLIIGSLGKVLDTLFKEIGDQLPILVPVLMELVLEIVKLLPALTKLLPPLTKIAIQFIKFLTPVTVNLLIKLVELFVKLADYALPKVELGIDALLELLTMLGEWWDREGEGIKKFWTDVLGKGIDRTIGGLKRLVGWVEQFVVVMKDGLRLFGIVSEKEKQQTAKEAQSQAHFEHGQSSDMVTARWNTNIAAAEKRWRREGKSAGWIAANKNKMIAHREMAALASLTASGRKDGGYITRPEVAMIGEAGNEWVVPDTPEGLRKFLPEMINKAITGSVNTGGTQSATVLNKIAKILQSIEALLADQADGALPEML